MTLARLPRQQRLIFGATAVAGVVVMVGLWLLAGLSGAPRALRPSGAVATATVVTTVPCQGPNAHDVVSAPVNGHDARLSLDGCGHPQGQRLAVLVPESAAAGALVEPVGAALGDSAGLVHRVAFLLLVISAAAGGACSFLLWRIANWPWLRASPHGGGGGFGPPPPAKRESGSPQTETNWFGDTMTGAMDPLRNPG